MQVADMFRDEESAKGWLEKARWPTGPRCPDCGSKDVQTGIKHKSMMYRCRTCPEKTMFSLKSGTVMERSHLSYRVWAIAIYLFTTNIKGVSSMRLHRELGITQSSAWFMLHRLRKAYSTEQGPFNGPVEVDETYVGGKFKNMHRSRRKRLQDSGDSGKTIVVGVKDRETNAIAARVVSRTDSETLHGFVEEHTGQMAFVFTDDWKGYLGMDRLHRSVNHSISEYVRGQVHVNGVESFWSMLKRGYQGTFHKMSPKHLDRYIQEFTGRHNVREMDTEDQMAELVFAMEGKRLTYSQLIADNGLSAGARSSVDHDVIDIKWKRVGR